MIVAKFGGSSVKDAKAMKRCAHIIKSTPSISLVILSATYNTTNELDFIFSTYLEKGRDALEGLVHDLISRHQKLETELLTSPCPAIDELYAEFRSTIGELPNTMNNEEAGRWRDHMLAFGERISTTLFYHFLSEELERPVEFVKSYEYLKTDSNYGGAHYQEESLQRFVEERYAKCPEGTLFVTQGYIGSNDEGHITTLGREGSDYSAALYGQAISAREVIIWTDVPGIFSADPNKVEDAFVIRSLSYDQAKMMALSGAKVLYPETMAPLKKEGIPLRVRSTRELEDEGSLISNIAYETEGPYAVATESKKEGMTLTIMGEVKDDYPYPLIEKSADYSKFYIPLAEKTEALKLAHQLVRKNIS